MADRATLAAQGEAIRRMAGTGRRIAFVSGNFNVVHPGHLRLLRFAADNGDFLVVGVNPDEAPGVTVPLPLRLEGVRAVSLVGHAVALRSAPEAFVAGLQPEIVLKGKEFEGRFNAELATVEAYGGRLLFGSGEVRFSSLDLLRREYFRAAGRAAIVLPRAYPARHGFDVAELKDWLPRLSGLRALVIGDVIVDTYIDCDALGMSQEDPTLVVAPLATRSFVGGAGIVAAHARGLGAEVRLLTVAGADSHADFLARTLHAQGVGVDILRDATRPTTHKQRYRAKGKTLLRVNELRQHSVDAALSAGILTRAEALLGEVDLLLLSDFNYGCLPQPLVEAVSGMAARRGIPAFADSQASSQLADISRFRGMKLVTPTEHEARLALRDTESGLAVLAERLQEVTQAENVVVTLGAEGALIRSREAGQVRTDRLPAFNTAPKDVAGAGDSFFACLSLALRAGAGIWRGAYIAALAAGCQVSRMGNLPLTLDELGAELGGALR